MNKRRRKKYLTITRELLDEKWTRRYLNKHREHGVPVNILNAYFGAPGARAKLRAAILSTTRFLEYVKRD